MDSVLLHRSGFVLSTHVQSVQRIERRGLLSCFDILINQQCAFWKTEELGDAVLEWKLSVFQLGLGSSIVMQVCYFLREQRTTFTAANRRLAWSEKGGI